MRVCVLQAGRAAPEARARRGDYGAMFVELLAEPGERWTVWDVRDAAAPERPARWTDHDAYLITGSTRAAYDDRPWIADLLQTARELHAARIPLVGVCFGAQIVAQGLGGRVVPNPAGWELGIREVSLTSAGRGLPLLGEAPTPLRILETHMDIVERLPPGAVRLGESPRTPVELFALGDAVLGLQGHPEMDNPMIVEIAEGLGERLPADRRAEALASLAAEAHVPFLRRLLRAFLTREADLLAGLRGLPPGA